MSVRLSRYLACLLLLAFSISNSAGTLLAISITGSGGMACCRAKRMCSCHSHASLHNHGGPVWNERSSCPDGCCTQIGLSASPPFFIGGSSSVIINPVAVGNAMPLLARPPTRYSSYYAYLFQRPPPHFLAF